MRLAVVIFDHAKIGITYVVEHHPMAILHHVLLVQLIIEELHQVLVVDSQTVLCILQLAMVIEAYHYYQRSHQNDVMCFVVFELEVKYHCYLLLHHQSCHQSTNYNTFAIALSYVIIVVVSIILSSYCCNTLRYLILQLHHVSSLLSGYHYY